MKFIFQLGNVQPVGLNINFNFILKKGSSPETFKKKILTLFDVSFVSLRRYLFIHLNINKASFFVRFVWLDAATPPYYTSTIILMRRSN